MTLLNWNVKPPNQCYCTQYHDHHLTLTFMVIHDYSGQTWFIDHDNYGDQYKMQCASVRVDTTFICRP